jgi:hypothetical protein
MAFAIVLDGLAGRKPEGIETREDYPAFSRPQALHALPS